MLNLLIKVLLILICSVLVNTISYANETAPLATTTTTTTAASTDTDADLFDEEPVMPTNDPLESFNRHTFTMNQTLDKHIFKPIAKGYKAILPYPVTKCISNFFSNLTQIPTIINDILQLQLLHADADIWRFAVNSTVGIGGLFDVAQHIGLEPHYEDFGLTMARWGYKSSSYFVIPILGPGSIRDAVGIIPNYYMSVYPYVPPVPRYSGIGLNFISQRANLLTYEKVLEAVQFDPYVFQRNAYFQQRAYLIKQNDGPTNLKPGTSTSYVMGTVRVQKPNETLNPNDIVPVQPQNK